MKLPRDMSGRALIRGLEKAFGYRRVHQVGSHVVLQTESPQHHRLAAPEHKALRPGTLNAILRAVAEAQGVSKDDVLRALLR